MKRSEILQRLSYKPSKDAIVRMIVDTDAKNEADDQFAIMHHLLTPIFDVRGITAAHFEQKAGYNGESMEKSYLEAVKVVELAQIGDVPVYRGCISPLKSISDTPESDAVDAIIREALSEDERPLFIAVQGAMTNIAAAINKEPSIAERMTVIWNGGGIYPEGGREFNLTQDPDAVRVVLASKATVWQVPMNVYAKFEISLPEVIQKVRPCGEIGKYLVEQLVEEAEQDYSPTFRLRTGDNWTLGDNTTIAVLIQNDYRGNWTMRHAPKIGDDLSYIDDPQGKMIRVYHDLDVRMALEDFFAKMSLAYGS